MQESTGNKKKKVIIALIIGLVLVAALVTGIVLICIHRNDKSSGMNEQERFLLGDWTYIHDRKTKVAEFNRDGSAKYEGKKGSFTADGNYIYFTYDKGNTEKLRYARKQDSKKEMTVYIASRYVLENGETPSSVAGAWYVPEKNWTFEFSTKGTFLEDGVLTGHYFVDEENGTIRLVYEKALNDTIMYYSLSKDGLVIEYPWDMVKK